MNNISLELKEILDSIPLSTLLQYVADREKSGETRTLRSPMFAQNHYSCKEFDSDMSFFRNNFFSNSL